MPLLTDLQRKLRETPDDGDLVSALYVPLLSFAGRNDRLEAASDYEALENPRCLALADKVPEPEQLNLFAMEVA